MKKSISRFLKQALFIGIFCVTLSSGVFAAWWGTPGYEWAKEKKLTSITNTAALNNYVSLSDLYSTILKYLDYKDVKPKENVIQNVGDSNCYNKGLSGILAVVDGYLDKTALTPSEYRVVTTYIEHANKILSDNQNYLTRDNLKNVYLYLSIAKYKAATMIDNYEYKTYVLSTLGSVKFKDLVKYNIKPYYGEITRKEFLVLMFSLLSNQSVSEDEILRQFDEAGIILGYEDDLMLTKNLTYAEMFTFLRRFEVFDFNPVVDENGEDQSEVITEIK